MNLFQKAVYKFIRYGIKTFLDIFLEFKVWGKGNIPEKGAKIYCSNHFSSTDPFFVITLMDEVVHMIIGPGFKIPVLRHVLKAGQQINALPENRKIVIPQAISYLQKNEAIYIFPEGTLNNQQQLLQFYTGMAKIYLEHPCPIVPIGIVSPLRYVQESEADIVVGESVQKTLTVLSGKYYANIGEPMTFPEYEKMEDKNAAAQLITEKVKERIEQLILDIKHNKFWS